jgi:cytochrome c oxidase assembly protein subunit 11
LNASSNNDGRNARNNWVVVGACLSFVFGMVGMSYAAVPLYRLFCEVTGYNGTTQRVEQASNVILDRKIKVRFDANIDAGLNWEFEPDQREIEVRIGETVKVNYHAINRSQEATTGQAIYNVTPQQAGAYFNKIECFCFTETTLKPGERLEMPVIFFVDPDMVKPEETKNINTITLSYRMYPHAATQPVAATDSKQGQTEKKL